MVQLNVDGPEWGPEGPCMNEVFQAFGNNNNLQCTAKEVTMEVTEVEGPDTCEQETIITVNIVSCSLRERERYYFFFIYPARSILTIISFSILHT